MYEVGIADFEQAWKKGSFSGMLIERYPEVSEDDLRSAIDKYDQSLRRACVLYADSESEKLWIIENIRDFLIILINTKHMFYQNVMMPLKETDNEHALTALELFISSLGWEEFKHFNDDRKAPIVESFRSYVGMHLNEYLQDFEAIDLSDLDDE
ncbi:MAG: hypothetical protein HOB79_06050 [Rhodospirillaceae bacterium]|nr:hypothetical protein [Rhodospirillaceae bacterium]